MAVLIHPKSRAAWRRWLAKNHERGTGVWLVTYKKSTGKPRVEYDEAVEEALCFGWIDSTVATIDAERSKQYFAPRKPGSGWSKSNKERVARLTASGLMTPAGLAKVEAAKKNGSWTKLDALDTLEVPRDLSQALKAYKNAAKNFEAFPPSARRNILGWIADAKKPETRARRIDKTARLAEENVRANQ